ncbi:MAG: nitroreductase family protein, partial [Candidatus Adiutrix sp.]|nr:nitroreductase family protein [Candidatus Adiutrix sp.]
WRYEWSGHKLVEVASANIRAQIGGPGFSKQAAYILILVSEAEALKAVKNQASAADFAQVLTGAMTQNIYLAAASLKLGARYLHSMNVAGISEALKLAPEDKPICLMLLGN